MEWSKAKTILIMLMLAANIFLGANIVIQLNENRRGEAEMVNSAWSIISGQGVSVDKELLLDMPDSMSGYVFSRNPADEKAAAKGLLGECREVQPGGGIYSYTSEKGELIFRSGGYIELYWNDEGSQPDLEGFLSAAAETGLQARDEDGRWLLYMDETPVDGALFLAEGDGDFSGNWIFGDLGGAEVQTLSRSAMILALGQAVRSQQSPVISSLDAAYVMTAMQNGEIRLTPVWRAVCGRSTFYISALTGEQISLQSGHDA